MHGHLPVLAAALFPLAMCASAAAGDAVGEFDGATDVGAPKIAGATHYDSVRQEYRLTGGGADLWGTRDEFHYLWKRTDGDVLLRARTTFVGPGIEPHRKIGWHLRPDLAADAPYVDLAAHGSGLISLQYRRSRGGITRELVLPVSHADVLQLERRGTICIASAARFGEPFVTTEITDIDLGNHVLAGLFVCAHNPDAAETARFQDVRIIRPAAPGFRPYHDYLGSTLEVLDVESGRLEILRRFEEPIEAPNWTRDGRALIWNVSGSGPNRGILERFDLATRQITRIESGFATHNNNDHVLSFDGTMLAISNQGPETEGRSAVYVLPATGGAPRQVTPLTPSYLHGWSPDGKWLVYTGGRADTPGGRTVFSIYKIPVAGGPEIRLTNGAWLDDGPEFSPDGKYIYFNSTRSGRMQLWRMNPDGADPEPVTGDAYNNWFPHLSPDGKWIAFLSYQSDVAPEDHPYYRQVCLRVMPSEGGPARILGYVYGGQGTMNVPSWSPDGRRLAFVSN